MSFQSAFPDNAIILIVDDNYANLRLLDRILSNANYIVHQASSGQAALTAVSASPPDLILLDIAMPGMDGFHVCRRLKENEQTENIPVIFVSASEDEKNIAESFSIGGVDYISKPFRSMEILARVKTHLTIQQLQKSQRQQIADLDAFAHTVAHDLKNPLALITGFANLLVNQMEMANKEEIRQIAGHIKEAGHRSTNIIHELLLLAGVQKQEVETTPVDMTLITWQAQQRLRFTIESSGARIREPEQWPIAIGYAPWLEEVWVNYISNSLKYGGSPPEIELGATLIAGSNQIRYWVRDNGDGISPADQETIFAEFFRTNHARADGHGLGLSIVRRIVEKLGGDVGVESAIGQGSTFYFTLPAAKETTNAA